VECSDRCDMQNLYIRSSPHFVHICTKTRFDTIPQASGYTSFFDWDDRAFTRLLPDTSSNVQVQTFRLFRFSLRCTGSNLKELTWHLLYSLLLSTYPNILRTGSDQETKTILKRPPSLIPSRSFLILD
jgi:hypothetical protein